MSLGVRLAVLLFVGTMLVPACSGAKGHATATPVITATPTAPVQRPDVAAMKTSFAQGTPFPKVPTPEPDTRLRVADMSFLDPSRGWVLLVSEISTEVVATIDAGQTWTTQYQGKISGWRIQFVDAMHGWVAGHDVCAYPPTPACHGVLLATSDGGATWTQTSPTTEWIDAVAFASPSDGWALGVEECNACDVWHLLRTNDGGLTWQSEPLPGIGFGYQLFRFGSEGIIPRRNDILVSEDNGLTWTPRENGCGTAFLYEAWFNDRIHGWTVCGDGRAGGMLVEKFVHATSDGGITWELRSQFMWGGETPPAGIGEAPGGAVEELVFSTEKDGWMGTPNGIFWTQDGGRSWTPAAGFERGDNGGRTIFLDAKNGFMAPDSSLFASTNDGGLHWRDLALPR
jgi:photosystem II stability/assembly factor-like uncharacterized protein